MGEKMKPFNFLEPNTIEEACSLLSRYKEEAKLIAGGQSLLPILKQRLASPNYLINLLGIAGLNHIDYDDKEGLRLGALVTHRTLEKSPLIQEKFPVLSSMAHKIGSIQIRNVGTIGGSLCHAEPAADPPTALLMLGAGVKAVSKKGERNISLDEFFTDYYETALSYDEIVTEIHIPPLSSNTGTSYMKFNLRAGDMAIVGVGVAISLDESKKVCRKARIALGAVGPTPIRAIKTEEMLMDKEIDDGLIERAAKQASEEAKPTSDIHASEWYRREIVKVLTEDALREALEMAKK